MYYSGTLGPPAAITMYGDGELLFGTYLVVDNTPHNGRQLHFAGPRQECMNYLERRRFEVDGEVTTGTGVYDSAQLKVSGEVVMHMEQLAYGEGDHLKLLVDFVRQRGYQHDKYFQERFG